jgi:hypothetical protein
LGGQKIVMDGGDVCLPVFHELIWVNMIPTVEGIANAAQTLGPRTLIRRR